MTLVIFPSFFQVAGILDSILHQTMTLMKKIELGKNFWSFAWEFHLVFYVTCPKFLLYDTQPDER